MDDAISWLQELYNGFCDGDWEHGWGIAINTIDNPGWSVRIELEGTPLEDHVSSFLEITKELSDNDWFHCRIQDCVFEGFGGPYNLKDILDVFRRWNDTVQF